MSGITSNEIIVDLPDHGVFATTIDVVARLERATKWKLARRIADAYGGGCGKASTVTYWLRTYPKSVLVVVLGGLIEPTR